MAAGEADAFLASLQAEVRLARHRVQGAVFQEQHYFHLRLDILRAISRLSILCSPTRGYDKLFRHRALSTCICRCHITIYCISGKQDTMTAFHVQGHACKGSSARGKRKGRELARDPYWLQVSDQAGAQTTPSYVQNGSASETPAEGGEKRKRRNRWGAPSAVTPKSEPQEGILKHCIAILLCSPMTSHKFARSGSACCAMS